MTAPLLTVVIGGLASDSWLYAQSEPSQDCDDAACPCGAGVDGSRYVGTVAVCAEHAPRTSVNGGSNHVD